MALSRKHYRELADIFKECRQAPELDRNTIEVIQNEVQNWLFKDNPSFKHSVFMDWAEGDKD